MSEDEELMTLTEIARLLGMKLSNVRAFLDRHGVQPVVDMPRHSRWRREDVLAAKAEYEASGRAEADARRSEALRR